MTNPHNFTLTDREEALYPEFQDLARKDHKTVSDLIRKWIIRYVESKNLKVVDPPKIILPNLNLKLLTYKGRLNPWAKDHPNHPKWEIAFGSPKR